MTVLPPTTYGAGHYGIGEYSTGEVPVVVPTRAHGFILDEDEALKLKLENYGKPFQVINYSDLRPINVAVYYRSPDPEIRQRTFPHVTIDLIDVQPDYERMHVSAGFSPPLPNVATQTPLASGFSYWSDKFPMPWKLIYQLSALSRDPTHDRQLGMMLYRMFPFAFGELDMSMIDGTMRRADLISTTRRDLPADKNNKRIFRQIFTIGVSSEYFFDELAIPAKVFKVDTTVEEILPRP